MTDESLRLSESDLPPLLSAAGAASAHGQSLFVRATALSLLCGVAAAAFGIARSTDAWAPALAGGLFVAAAGLSVYLWGTRPERVWYDARAAAESIKTLSWQYAVGGAHFPVSLDPREADQLLLERLTDVMTSLGHLPLDPPGGPEISRGLRMAREADLMARRDLYHRGRVADQRHWYSQKSRYNRRCAHAWALAIVVVQIAGAVMALLRAFDLVTLDLIGISAAIAASATAWLQAKDHATLAEAYSVTAHELAAIESRIDEPATEEDWASFVDDAESAISREHVLWRARRGRVLPTELRRHS